MGVQLRAGDADGIGIASRPPLIEIIDARRSAIGRLQSCCADLEVDVAVDLMGFTDGSRPGIFAHRSARVQVSYLDMQGLSARPTWTILLADAVVIPPDQEQWYTEKVIRLPNCFLPNDDQRPIAQHRLASRLVLPAHGLVFCAFTNAYKINPPVFECGCGLLRQVPHSVLWATWMGCGSADESDTRGALAWSGSAATGLCSARNEHGRASGRHQLADLYWIHRRTTRTPRPVDALWAGVPVLTCTGRTFAGSCGDECA